MNEDGYRILSAKSPLQATYGRGRPQGAEEASLLKLKSDKVATIRECASCYTLELPAAFLKAKAMVPGEFHTFRQKRLRGAR